MYDIYLLSNIRNVNQKIDMREVISAKVNKQINMADTFTMQWTGESYPQSWELSSLTTGIVVRDKISGEIIFGGRIISIERDMYGLYTINGEGALAYLNDMVVPPYVINKANGWDPNNRILYCFKYAGKYYNEINYKHDTNARWNFIVFDDLNCHVANSIKVANNTSTDYQTCLDFLKQNVIDSAGLVIEMEYVPNGSIYFIPKIHIRQRYSGTSSQVMELGYNIMDCNVTHDYTDVCTRVYPFGAFKKDGTTRVSLKDAGEQYGYIQASTSLMDELGMIAHQVIFEDITSGTTLLQKADQYLADHIVPKTTIQVKAIDLHLKDRTMQPFKIGQKVHLNIPTQDLSADVQITSIDYDLTEPEKTMFTCENSMKTHDEWLRANLKVLKGGNSYNGLRQARSDNELINIAVKVVVGQNTQAVTPTTIKTTLIVPDVVEETETKEVELVGTMKDVEELEPDDFVIKDDNDNYFVIDTSTLDEEQKEALESVEIKKETLGTTIVVGSIKADKIDVTDLFAQEIKATGTIEGATLKTQGDEYGNHYDMTINNGQILIDTTNDRGNSTTEISGIGIYNSSTIGGVTKHTSLSLSNGSVDIEGDVDINGGINVRGFSFEGINFEDLFIVETLHFDDISVNANNYHSESVAIQIPPFYKPIGIVGSYIYNATTGGTNGALVTLAYARLVNGSLAYRLRNVGSSNAKVHYIAYVLYVRDTSQGI